MEYNTHYQCSLCARLNNEINNQSKGPIVFYYDLVSNMNSYINYINLVNQNFVENNDSRFIQNIDQRDNLVRSHSMGNANYIYDDPHSNNAGVLLCTCNDFINHTIQSQENAKPFHSLMSQSVQLPQLSGYPIHILPQIPVQSNSLYHHNQQTSIPVSLRPTQSSGPILHHDSIHSLDNSNIDYISQEKTISTEKNQSIQQKQNSNNNNNNNNNEDICGNSIYSNNSVASEPMCRFCHLTKNSTIDPLISPCLCSGTLKLVHHNCLRTWLEVSKKQRENSNVPDKTPHCELCNFKYIRKRKFQCGNLKYPKLSQNDCALHLIFLCSLLVMLTSASVTILCFAMEKSSSNLFNPVSNNKMISNFPQKWPPRIENDIRKLITHPKSYQPALNRPPQLSSKQLLTKCHNNCTKSTNYLSSNKKQPIESYFQNKPNNHNIENNDKANNDINNDNNINSRNNKLSDSSINYMRRRTRLWILSPEEAVTLASGVIFFIAFFIAMVVQVKSSYTCYQLIMQWIRLNYTYEVQPLRPLTPPLDKNTLALSVCTKRTSKSPINSRHSHMMMVRMHKKRAAAGLSKCCIITVPDDYTTSHSLNYHQYHHQHHQQQQQPTLPLHNHHRLSSPPNIPFSSQSSSSSTSPTILRHNRYSNSNIYFSTSATPREYIERCVTEI